jgi:exodeoxyribonuclease-3
MYFSGEKSYNGVSILTKIKADNIFSLSLYNQDKRHIVINCAGIEIHNFYVPAGGDVPDVLANFKFKHKLEYVHLMHNWFKNSRTRMDKIILLGDLNIAPYENDVWSSKQLRNVVSHTDIERFTLRNMCDDCGFIDSARHFTPLEQKCYTWWSYRNRDWRKSNRGRRLDHAFVSESLKNRLKSILIVDEARSWPCPSDHVPYILDLYD